MKIKSMKKYFVPAFIVFLGLLYGAKSTYDDIKATADAYLYTYPLMLMEETYKKSMLTSQINTLSHSQEFPDVDFRLVVRPNFDTLYSTVWFDLSKEIQILSMPATDDRYYVLPFMDAWTNVFETIGTSTTGNKAQEIAIVGPNYNGDIPEGVTSVVKSPTNMVWLIARIQTEGDSDIPNVIKIQNEMKLTPLAAWQQGERLSGTKMVLNSTKSIINPMKVIETMGAQEFFSKANHYMAEQPPLTADDSELNKFAYLNISPGEKFDLNNLSLVKRWAVEKSLQITRAKIDEALKAINFNEQGWNIVIDDIGTYGTNYLFRAAVAKIGLGALPAKEAAYPSTQRLPNGEKYDGSKFSYRLHFSADKLPPVNAFWSLTVYDFEGYMNKNKLNRYSLGDRSNMTLNKDGSLDIYIQHQQPKQHVNNWLPVPQDIFNLTLRMYLPKESFLTGEWVLPMVEKTPNLT